MAYANHDQSRLGQEIVVIGGVCTFLKVSSSLSLFKVMVILFALIYNPFKFKLILVRLECQVVVHWQIALVGANVYNKCDYIQTGIGCEITQHVDLDSKYLQKGYDFLKAEIFYLVDGDSVKLVALFFVNFYTQDVLVVNNSMKFR